MPDGKKQDGDHTGKERSGKKHYAVFRRCPERPTDHQVASVEREITRLGLHSPTPVSENHVPLEGNSSNSSCSITTIQAPEPIGHHSKGSVETCDYIDSKNKSENVPKRENSTSSTVHVTCPKNTSPLLASKSASFRIKAGLSHILPKQLSDRLLPPSSLNNTQDNSLIHRHKLHVSRIKASLDKKPIFVDENSSAVLKYRTPLYRASARVEVPELVEGDRMQIGWIQTCTEMCFVNAYGSEGITSWEFPELQTGKYKMMSDSDGKQYPWYGARTEMQEVCGPAPAQSVNVHMNDNFFPQVTWHIPDGTHDKTARLTHVHRMQRFVVFLMARDLVTSQCAILRTVIWSMKVNIKVNPKAPLGKRACLLHPTSPGSLCQPRVLSENPIHLERTAYSPPNANSCQALVWRPVVGPPTVVVTPIQTTVKIHEYVMQTITLGEKLRKRLAAEAKHK